MEGEMMKESTTKTTSKRFNLKITAICQLQNAAGRRKPQKRQRKFNISKQAFYGETPLMTLLFHLISYVADKLKISMQSFGEIPGVRVVK